jgi:hypothetical protein
MAGHSHFSPSNVEEHFEFTAEGRKRVIYAFLAGTIALIVGIFLLSRGEHEAVHAVAEHGAEHGSHESGGAVSHHVAYDWTTRIWANLWLNSVFFTGIAVIGMFFVSIQYLAKAGWSSVVKRVAEAFPPFLIITGSILIFVFLYKGDVLFHWMHEGVTVKGSENYDKVIAGKSGYLNKWFFLGRMVFFFGGG